MSQRSVGVIITPASNASIGPRVRFPDDSNVFPEESIHRTMLRGLNVGLTRNDRSEQDLDSYNEGTHGARSDKRELGHR